MEISKETSQSVEELQILEQNLQNFLAQKQAVQMELREVENALDEIERTKDDVFRMLSGVMLKADKEDLNKELSERKKLMELRIDSIEKQEKIIEDRVVKLREELNKSMKKDK